MTIRHLFRLDRHHADVPRDVDEELAFHLAMRTDALIRQGLSAEHARQEAARQFGNLDVVRDDCISLDHQRENAVHRISFVEEFAQDVRYTLRILRRSYAFTAAVVLVLSLGIGANTAIYSMVEAVLRRSLPVEHPERLLAIGDPTRVSSFSQGDVRTDLMSWPMYLALRRDSVFGANLLASGRPPRLDVRIDADQAEVEHPRGRLVSDNYFRVLGQRAQMGRAFDGHEDEVLGGSPVAVISDSWWTRRFNRDAQAVGRKLAINGVAFTIIGIMPPSFSGEIVGVPHDLWMPASMMEAINPHQPLFADQTSSWLLGMLRVPDAMTMAQGEAAMRVQIKRWIQERATPSTLQSGAPEPMVSAGSKGFSRVRRNLAAPLTVLMMGVGLLLLLVCANVANLLLARAIARGREMSVRLAIGARRGRLIRQLITESMVLAALGAVGGLVVAWYSGHLLLRLASQSGGGNLLDLRLDPPVLAFTVLVALVSVVCFGLMPALHASRVDLSSAMRGNTIGWMRSGHGRRPGLSQLLVSGQVALSLALLVSAGLLARDLRFLEQVDTGFDRDHLLAADVDATGAGYDSTRQVLLAESLRREAARTNGLTAISYSANGFYAGSESNSTIAITGYVKRSEHDLDVNADQVGPDYVRATGARLLSGRDINEFDVPEREPVALVNEAFARKFFAGRSALDGSFHDGSITYRIVGVVADVRDHALDGPVEPRFYSAYRQNVSAGARSLRFVLRSSGDPQLLTNAFRAVVHRVDASLVVEDVATVADRISRSIATERLLMQVALLFGALALLLAAIGLYGVMTYVVNRRTSEIGLRMALGAGRISVLRLVLFDAMKLVLLGVLFGVPASLALARALGGQLHGVAASDPVTLLVALVVLTASALLAAFVPALRASRVAPMMAIGRG